MSSVHLSHCVLLQGAFYSRTHKAVKGPPSLSRFQRTHTRHAGCMHWLSDLWFGIARHEHFWQASDLVSAVRQLSLEVVPPGLCLTSLKVAQVRRCPPLVLSNSHPVCALLLYADRHAVITTSSRNLSNSVYGRGRPTKPGTHIEHV